MTAAQMPVLYVKPFTLGGRSFDKVEPLSLYAIRTYRPLTVLQEIKSRTEPREEDFALIAAIIHDSISNSNMGATYPDVTLEWVERALNLSNFAPILTCILQGSGFEQRPEGEAQGEAVGQGEATT